MVLLVRVLSNILFKKVNMLIKFKKFGWNMSYVVHILTFRFDFFLEHVEAVEFYFRILKMGK